MQDLTNAQQSQARIVLIHHDVLILNELVTLVLKAGLTPFPFNHSEIALSSFSQTDPPDLIVADLFNSGLDGLRFCQLLRSPEHSYLNTVPILGISSKFLGDSAAKLAMDFGANAFIDYPIDENIFIEKIKSLVQGKHLALRPLSMILSADLSFSEKLSKTFMTHNYAVQLAENFQEGMDSINQNDYAVVIISIPLPEDKAVDLVSRILKKSPECLCVLINVDENQMPTRLSFGGSVLIQGPTDSAILFSFVEQIRNTRFLNRINQAMETRISDLLASEEQYRDYIQNSSEPIFAFNPDETYRFVNPAFARPFGKTPEEIIGKTPFEIFPQDEAEKRLTLVRHVFKSGEKGEIEVKVIDVNGMENYYLTHVEPIKNEAGHVVYATCTSKNITARKQAEIDLNEKALYMRTILQTTNDGFWILNKQGKIIEVNDAYSELSGYAPDELLQLSIMDLDTAADPQDISARIQQVIANGADRFETRHRRKDGSYFDVEILTRYWEKDGGQIICFCRDISERKRVEKELNDQLSLIRHTQEIGHLGSWEYATETNELTWSDEVFRIFKMQPEEFGATYEAFMEQVYPSDRKAVDTAYWDSIRSGAEGFEIEHRVILKEPQELIYVYERCFHERDASGKVIRSLGTVQDITEQKRIENMLQKRLVALTRPMDQNEEILFDELFDIDLIQRLQDQFSNATGVASIITYPDGVPITKPSNFCRLCNDVIRKTKRGLDNCFKSDAILGRFHPDGPIIQPCMSGGLWDAGAGISVGGKHIANWLIGQVRNETQTEEQMRAYARLIGAEESEVLAAFHEVPAMSMVQFQRVSEVLFTIANQLSDMAYQNVQQARFITERQQAEHNLEEKLLELRRWQNATMGREDRILQLKTEVNELLLKDGKSERYPSAVNYGKTSTI